jgi:flagellar hook-length control protein FliK
MASGGVPRSGGAGNTPVAVAAPRGRASAGGFEQVLSRAGQRTARRRVAAEDKPAARPANENTEPKSSRIHKPRRTGDASTSSTPPNNQSADPTDSAVSVSAPDVQDAGIQEPADTETGSAESAAGADDAHAIEDSPAPTNDIPSGDAPILAAMDPVKLAAGHASELAAEKAQTPGDSSAAESGVADGGSIDGEAETDHALRTRMSGRDVSRAGVAQHEKQGAATERPASNDGQAAVAPLGQTQTLDEPADARPSDRAQEAARPDLFAKTSVSGLDPGASNAGIEQVEQPQLASAIHGKSDAGSVLSTPTVDVPGKIPNQGPATSFGSGTPSDASTAPEIQFAKANHSQMVKAISGQLLPRGGAMHIRLDPPELGSMQVSVRMIDGAMTASFQTSNEQATQLLSHSLSHLKQLLEAQGISVERLHVQQATSPMSDRQTGEDAQQQQRQGSPEEWAQHQQEQQRRELLRRMWRRMAGGGDPLDLVA